MAPKAAQVFNSKKLLLVLLVLSVILIIQDNMAVEGIFFLDILCATRIANLERQVSNLIAQLGSSNSGSISSPIVSPTNNG